MKFLVVTNAPTLKEGNCYRAYAPYVREMDIWSNYVDEFEIISPTLYNQKLLKSSFIKQPIVTSIPSLNFSSVLSGLESIFYIPKIVFRLFKAMKRANHIHLRCPGNIGLLGCFVQICFPKKIKTAKYAGNWDPKAKQPLSYKFQKWILSNTFLTKNMTVLVYGEWENQTKNIKPFFTASFKNSEKEVVGRRNYKEVLNFVFVGSLVSGKRPELAIKIVEGLVDKGVQAKLTLYGDGILKESLVEYVNANNLNSFIVLEGNQALSVIKENLKTAHFSLLPSKSEGWPKAVAEAMFFGAIPISTAVSCVSNMLDGGRRGVLIEAEVDSAVNKIISVLDEKDLNKMSKLAAQWSQNYTLDYFESEIKKLLTK